MAYYLGACESCNRVEYEASVHAAVPTECPRCGREGFTRLIYGSTQFFLKGGGWANDGYGECSHPRFYKGSETGGDK